MLKNFVYKIIISNGVDNYILSNVENNAQEPFLRVDCEIIKSSYQQLNSGNIMIYNLSKKIRDLFCKSPVQVNKKIQVILEIGYKTRQPTLIWSGFLIKSIPDKEQGHTIIFEMEGFNGGNNIENVFASFRVNENSTILDLKKEYANSLGLDMVSSSMNDTKRLKNGWTTNTKNAFQELKEIFKNEDIYIENEKLTFVDDEYYKNMLANNFFTIPKITEGSGLSSTVNKGNTVEVEMALNPYIKRGSLVELDTRAGVGNRFNGIYKVVGLKHNGSISYITANKNITTLELRTFDNSLLIT
jgi:hypothetical protein